MLMVVKILGHGVVREATSRTDETVDGRYSLNWWFSIAGRIDTDNVCGRIDDVEATDAVFVEIECNLIQVRVESTDMIQ